MSRAPSTACRSRRIPKPGFFPGLVFALALLTALAAAPTAGAQLVPDGPRVDVGGVGEGAAPGGRSLDDQRPRVLVAADGSFLVFWWDAGKDPSDPRLLGRRFAADGTPMWAAREFYDPVDGIETVGGLDDVAMNADGDFAIAWVDPEAGVRVRVFDACGVALGPMVDVGLGTPQPGAEVVGVEAPAVALTGGRIAVVGWIQVLQQTATPGPTFEEAVLQRRAADGTPVASLRRLAADRVLLGLDVEAAPDGGFGVAVEALGVDPATSYIRFLRFAADGTPVPVPPVAPDLPVHPSRENPAVAANGDGAFVLAFVGSGGQGPDGVDGSCTGVFARFSPIPTNETRVHPEPAGCQGAPRAAGLAAGWAVGWAGADRDDFFGSDGSENGIYLTTYGADGETLGAPVRVLPAQGLPYDLAARGDRAAVAAVLPDATGEPRVVVQRLAPPGEAGCSDGAGHLCLQGDRFRVDADWRDPYNGGVGPAFGRDLRDDTGAFWFFREANLEMLVKVLDGRPVDGHWWVFYGALSTVESWITVTDLEAGEQNVYHNLPFVQASVADTGAFAGTPDGGGDTAAVPVLSAAARPGGPVTPLELAAPLTPATCDLELFTLCLHDEDFQIFVEWHDPRSGDFGSARKVSITDDTGAFWFFQEDNLELMVKVLDGRPVNGHWWVLWAGVSDVGYTITVEHGDTVQVYANEPFELRSGADTTAFPEE